MPRKLFELEPQQAKDLKDKAAFSDEHLKTLDDLFYISRWIDSNFKLLEFDGQQARVFNLNTLHKTARFKNSKKGRIDAALKFAAQWSICSEPFLHPNDKGPPSMLCRINPEFKPVSTDALKKWQQKSVDWLMEQYGTTR
jgi:hypothetical protein